jgi:two-component system response regulator CpxR
MVPWRGRRWAWRGSCWWTTTWSWPRLVGEYLTREGFADAETDGTHALDRAVSGDYQLTVLDVMLPGVSGLISCAASAPRPSVPVLMLTARGDDVDRIVGWSWAPTTTCPSRSIPASWSRGSARSCAGRRPRRGPATDRRDVGLDDVALDLGRRTVRRAGAAVELTAVEFTPSSCCCERPARWSGATSSLAEALGRAAAFDRSIDVHVSRLRKKLGPRPGGGERITTLRAAGYMYTR